MSVISIKNFIRFFRLQKYKNISNIEHYKYCFSIFVFIISLFRYFCAQIKTTYTMDIATNIRKLRENRDFTQKQIAAELGIGYSNYNKMENGFREPSVEELQKLAKLYDITVDELINPEDITPKEVVIQDKTVTERVRLIEQLEDEDKQAVYRVIDSMLTKSKFKDFFNKNIAML